jgi:hypothetical protein
MLNRSNRFLTSGDTKLVGEPTIEVQDALPVELPKFL